LVREVPAVLEEAGVMPARPLPLTSQLPETAATPFSDRFPQLVEVLVVRTQTALLVVHREVTPMTAILLVVR
jgi:hypothetical protein